MKYKLLVLLVLSGCSHKIPEPVVCLPKACYRSFYSTLRVWEAKLGRVPEACQYLDSEFTVQLVSSKNMPCKATKSFKVVGCTEPENKIISILEGQPVVNLIDVSVHEWEHALANCVDGDPDKGHVRSELWMEFGSSSIETQAQANAIIGNCL